ncbi:NAD(P)H-hydrate dehydratase [Janibacter melonis]|uniref:NAD(P)H-hydrate dehydratase n=1 Tax=Janibacter melonis TaxID=262209 RepID=UPI001786CAE8|nr:NAD(P)H-hydrate dehydratase [Janibacter melonis]
MPEQIPDEVSGGTLADPRLVTPDVLRRWPLPEPTGSKYGRGQAVVVGGSCSTPGAVLLAGISALRMGAGKLHLGVAEGVAPHLAVAVPESGVTALAQSASGSVTGTGAGAALERETGRADAVLVGPGLDDPEGSARLVTEVVPTLAPDAPVLLDAFGLTVLPDLDDDVLRSLRGRLIATPNPGELAHLLDRDEVEDDDVAEATVEAAERYDAVVGCGDWVASPDGALWRMTTGDTGLATSGSGDVCAGAALGLLSRGAGLVQALVWAKSVHAAAGDTLAMRLGRVGYLAGEIPSELPLVLRTLRGD